MNKIIIIQSPFNCAGFNKENEVNEEWIKNRLKVFIDYTLNSLKAQTNQWFTLLLRCREETIPFIKKETEGLLPDNVIIVGKFEYEQKIKDLIKDYNYLYLVRVDSDDLWINTFIDTLHNYTPKPETELLLNQYGYNYDIVQDRMISFYHSSPQSYVLIYRVKEYLEGKRHILSGGHWAAHTKIHEVITGYNYMDTVHGQNTSSTFESFKGQRVEIKGKDKEEILAEFGIYKKENIDEKKSI
jgi:hypothetical protein